MEGARSLEEICDDADFHIVIMENNYCILGLGKQIGCSRQEKVRDHNGLYRCASLNYVECKGTA